MATYATLDDLQDFIGTDRLAAMLGGDPTEHGGLAATLLEAASSKMDGAFEAAGYAVPIVATGNLAAQLTMYCLALAARFINPKLVDETEGVKKTADEAERWLQDIIAGRAVLLGIAKVPAVAQGIAAGRVGFVGSGEKNLSRALFVTHNTLVGGM